MSGAPVAVTHILNPAAAQADPGCHTNARECDGALPGGTGLVPRKVSATQSSTSSVLFQPAIAGTVTYTCDPTIDAEVAGTCNYLNTTIAGFYASRFTNASANIYIQYGITGLGGSSQFLNNVSYSTYRNALIAHSSGDVIDTAAIASLPTTEPAIFNSGSVVVSTALGTALGFSSLTGITSSGGSCSFPGAGCYNAVITVTTQANLTASQPGQTLYFRQQGGTQGPLAYDFYTVVQHETDEVLGTTSCIDTTAATLADGCGGTNASAVDLFRYSGASTRVFESTTPGAYFSYNGGVTKGADGAIYNTLSNGNDYADFVSNCVFVQDATGCLGGTFDITNDGAAELAILDAVGFNINVVAPSISKAFGSALIALNGSTTLTFTINNSNPIPLTGVGFTDNLPAGLVVAAVPSLTNSCAGTVSGATANSGSFTLSGGTLAGGATCNLSVKVTATTAGAKNNTTTAVTSVEGGNGNTASATLNVAAPPSISKTFTPGSIPLGGTGTLTFTVVNPDASIPLTNIQFTDTLPTGLTAVGAEKGAVAPGLL